MGFNSGFKGLNSSNYDFFFCKWCLLCFEAFHCVFFFLYDSYCLFFLYVCCSAEFRSRSSKAHKTASCVKLTKLYTLLILSGGTLRRSWLRHCATSRKVAGSIPDGVTGIYHWHNRCGRPEALRSTQALPEMSTRNISWGIKAAGA